MPAGATRLIAEVLESESPDLDLFMGSGDTPSAATELCVSASGTALEYCELPNADAPLEPGTYWILVQNWDDATAGSTDAFTLAVGVVDEDEGNLRVEGPASTTPAAPFDVRVFWDEPAMQAGDRLYGSFTLVGDGDPIATIPVNLSRLDDDVTKAADVATAASGDTVTYTIDVAPNVGSDPVTYTVSDTIPEGMTYVPGSATNGATESGGVISWTGTLGPPGPDFYTLTTGATDPSCVANSYFDLQPLGIGPAAGISGNNFAFTAFSAGAPTSYCDGAFAGVAFTDNGYLVFDFANNGGGQVFGPQPIPATSLPNAMIAALMQDFTVVRDVTAGAERGVRLASTGSTANDIWIIDYDEVELAAGGADRWTFQVTGSRSVFDAPGLFEYVIAFDEVGAMTGPLTIGLENIAGTDGTPVVSNGDGTADITDGTTLCFDLTSGAAQGETITYQATVDAGVADTNLTNIVEHITDNPGAMTAIASDTVTVGTPALPVVTVRTTTPVATPDADGVLEFVRSDPAGALTVLYDVSGTSVPGTDYEPLPGQITFEPGSNVATVDVDAIAPASAGTVIVTLAADAAYTVGQPGSATVTVAPEPPPPPGGGGGTPGGVPAVGVTAVGSTFTFSTAEPVATDLTVAYAVGGTAVAGEDYTALDGIVTIPAGSASATEEVGERDGATAGATVTATVVDGESYNVGTPASATVTLTGDGAPPPPPTPPPPTPPPPGEGDDNTVEQLFGPTRIETGVAVSQSLFGDDEAGAVVLARADIPFDALAGTPLAAANNAPTLLTDGAGADERGGDSDALHPATAAEIDRVLPAGGTVYLLGGESALEAGVETALTTAGYAVVRLAGPTRIETAFAVAGRMGEPDAVLIATSEQFPDALAAGAAADEAGGVVLLTPGGVAHPDVQAYLDARPDTPVYAAGGPAAAAFPTATPIVGVGREATARLLAEEFFTAPSLLGIARGDDFPDALTGGTHAAILGGPVLLTPPDSLGTELSAYICANADSLDQGFVYGGDAAVNADVVAAIADRINGVGC